LFVVVAALGLAGLRRWDWRGCGAGIGAVAERG
jgi:hypothetical protein